MFIHTQSSFRLVSPLSSLYSYNRYFETQAIHKATILAQGTWGFLPKDFFYAASSVYPFDIEPAQEVELARK